MNNIEIDLAKIFPELVTENRSQRKVMQPIPELNFSGTEIVIRALEDETPVIRSTGFYHPSSIHGCKRKTYLWRTGIWEPREKLSYRDSLRLKIGSEVHKIVQEKLARYSKKIGEKFEYEVDVEYSPLRIKGSVDGLFHSRNVAIEFKTCSHGQFERLGSKQSQNYLWQENIYLWCLDIPWMVAIYIDREQLSIKELRHKFDLKMWMEIEEKLISVEVDVWKKNLPQAEPDFGCKFCAFSWKCQPQWVPPIY